METSKSLNNLDAEVHVNTIIETQAFHFFLDRSGACILHVIDVFVAICKQR